MYRFNAVLYMIVTAFLFCNSLCLVPCSANTLETATAFSMVCLGCLAFPTLGAILTTAVHVYNRNGELCASNTEIYMTVSNGENAKEIELSWAGDGTMFRKLFLAQAALHIPLFVCNAVSNFTMAQIAFKLKHE